MNILKVSEKISVKEELLELYKANNIMVEEISNNYMIIDNIFLVKVSENQHKQMSVRDILKEYFAMEQIARTLSIKQFIIVSKTGFACDTDRFIKFNIRLEDNSYFEELQKYSPSFVELLCHNRHAVNYVRNMFNKGQKRACVIQPTGTGKSYIIESILKDFKEQEKVVIAPNNDILDQLKEIILKGQEDVSDIKFFTYSKIMHMEYCELEKLNPGIVIIDEIHRIGAEVWGRNLLEFLDMNISANVLGTTATPIREYDGLRDMSVELFGSNVLNNLDLAEAITREILPMPKYITAIYEIDNSLNKLMDMTSSSSKISVDKKEQIYEDIRKFKASWDNAKYIPNIISKHVGEDRGKFIVFCKNKEHLNEMTSMVVSWFKTAMPNKVINYSSITSFDSTTKAKKTLQDFKDKIVDGNSIELLFSINKLNEGIHIVSEDDNDDYSKGIDGVIFLRATSSRIIYYQQLGRALTANSKKQPLILDLVNNIDIVNDVSFKGYLRDAYNKRYEDWFNLFDKELCSNYLDDIDINIIDETQDFTKFFENTLYKITNSWNAMYDLLLEYMSEYGHCNVSKNNDCLKDKYKGLGNWVSYNRYKYLNDTLDKNSIDKLNNIGFVWNVLDAVWFEKYNELVYYKEKHGHCNVSVNCEEDKPLLLWMYRQAHLKRINKLSKDRVKLLDDIGFIWNRSKDISFEDRIKALKEYKNKYGTCNINSESEFDSLRNWVLATRKNKRKGKLTEEQITILDEIGFCWDAKEAVWFETFNILDKHVKEHGTVKMSSKLAYYNKVTIWLSKQKKYNEEGKLDDKRKSMLKSLGAI